MTESRVSMLLAGDVAAARLGIRVDGAREGTAKARMVVTNEMLNGHGIAHGGVIYTLADTAFAYACNSHGPMTVSAGADITYVAPARAGDKLVAEAVQRTGYGRHGIYDVTVRAGDQVIAEFRGRSTSPARRP